MRHVRKPQGWIFAFIALTTLQCGREQFDLLPVTAGAAGGTTAEAGESGAAGQLGGRDGNGGKFPGIAGFPGLGGSSCSSEPVQDVCTPALCDRCTAHEQCPGTTCFGGYCIECQSDAHCEPYEKCNTILGRCMKRCGEDGLSCQGGDPKLCANGMCTCSEANDCPEHLPFCHYGRCVECRRDCECALDFPGRADGPVCIRGRCGCRGRADCPPNTDELVWYCDLFDGDCRAERR